MTLIPKTGLAAENDAKTAEKLQKYKESLSKEEIEKIIADTKELAAYQEEEESEEALETIPLLKQAISNVSLSNFTMTSMKSMERRFFITTYSRTASVT